MTGRSMQPPTRRALLGGLAAALATRRVAARPAAPGFRGIYAAPPPLFDERRSFPDAVYAAEAVSGVYVRLVWSAVAPRPGAYDFRLLDRELGRAVAAGKRVSLSVIAGAYAPAWLPERGVRTLRFALGRGGANRSCLPVQVGVPWDSGYQAAFLDLWSALAERVRATPGGLEAVRIVKLTGVNQFTEEFRMPAGTGLRDDVCGRTDETAAWLAEGYRPARVVEAWTRMAAGIAERFPGTLLALDVLERNDVPPVDDAGAPTRDPPVKPRLIAEGRRRFGGRFAVQWNGLTAAGPLADTVLAARAGGTVIGWQSNAFRGLEGAGCNAARNAAPAACDTGGFGAILRRGVETGASYLEVWAPDVLQFPAEVAAADAALRAGDG
ncbi:hypothetical protein ACE7GA_05875 [Roseomonas sp. CCTCC AB2023176]|uniref:hypothetical protein n=1 Tax=Roseomonas sp. CCTCC AB2023176 TaxID=3342640 RepID=UPI0035E12117